MAAKSMLCVEELRRLRYQLRLHVLDIVYQAKAGHIGGDMSMADILAVLYFREMNIDTDMQENRDRFVLSKGHSMEAYYAVLAEKGFLDLQDILDHIGSFGTAYIGHPNNKLPGIEMNSGSLGHGLPVCVGMALAAKMDKQDYRVYTVMGDGELAEGSVWEAAMAAAHYGLNNLCAIVDKNGLQISGTTEQVMAHENLKERFEGFGWRVTEVDGNSIDALIDGFLRFHEQDDRPFLMIANTVKGCGVSFMENKAEWHHKVLSDEEYRTAREEIERALADQSSC